MMDAIILAGGFGTRLQAVVSDVPKPMAPINGRPFLEILLKSLSEKGIKRVILSVGYKANVIINYFGNTFDNLEIVYEVENSPLGTGGAIKAALARSNSKNVLVINGDTYLEFDMNIHQLSDMQILTPLIFGVQMKDSKRYGLIETDELGFITAFIEKKFGSIGTINSGHYILPKNILSNFLVEPPFSFESDFLPQSIIDKKWTLIRLSGKFIDIGVPEDFELAQGFFND